MTTGYEQVRPLKGVYQTNGDVILAEFTDDDFIPVISGGTGGTSRAGARISLEVIQYTEYNSFNEFEEPTPSRLSLDNQNGKLYYSYNNTWKEIANLTKSKYYTADGFDDVASFIFNNRFVTTYNDGTLSLDIDVVDITDRLDIIEGDASISGSILNKVQDNIDLLLDGVIPELDTLKEIATSLGDSVDIKSQIDIISNNLSTETINRGVADTLLTNNIITLIGRLDIIEGDVSISGSILNKVQDNIDLLLDGVIPELDTLKEIATSLGDTVDFKSQYDITVSDLLALNTKVDGIDSQVGNSQQILDIVQGQVDNLLDGVVPELNTLQKIAISLGNAVDIKDQLDVVSTNLATETTDRVASDVVLTTNLATETTDRSAADTLLTTNLTTEVSDRIASDAILTTNLATEISDRINDINNISSILNNFSYDGHDNNVLNDTHPTGLMLDKQTGKYKPSLLNLGHFIPFKRKNNDVDDINLISTFDGNVLISSTLRFWKHNGEQDNISFVIQ
jgi:hypothetical protein